MIITPHCNPSEEKNPNMFNFYDVKSAEKMSPVAQLSLIHKIQTISFKSCCFKIM